VRADVDRTLSALADPSRTAIVELLREGPRRPSQVATALEMSRPSLSRHLRVLRAAGLISDKPVADDARARLVQLRRAPFTALRGWVEQVEVDDGARRPEGAAMNTLTVRPERLARLRAICLALPEATEKEAWGDPTWRVRDRIFAMQKGNYQGGRPSVWFKGTDGAQAMLVGSDDCFFVPPYVGNKGWIGVYLDGKSVPWPMLAGLIEESYRLIAPKRLTASPPKDQAPRSGRRSSGRATRRRS